MYNHGSRSNVSFGHLPLVSTAPNYHLENVIKFASKSGHEAACFAKAKVEDKPLKKVGSALGADELRKQETFAFFNTNTSFINQS